MLHYTHKSNKGNNQQQIARLITKHANYKRQICIFLSYTTNTFTWMNNITICTSKQLILMTARHNEGINLVNYKGLSYFISNSDANEYYYHSVRERKPTNRSFWWTHCSLSRIKESNSVWCLSCRGFVSKIEIEYV